ncbi:MAG: serine hydrolase [Planctomycetaceae bacterium]|nr:serine hydrolase [Planctomycetaceae bacterium]
MKHVCVYFASHLQPAVLLALLVSLLHVNACSAGETVVSVVDGKWHINGRVINPASAAEGLLMNVRMVNAVFEDRSGKRPDFDAQANTAAFVAAIPDYVAHGVNAFTVSLQGGMPGYEGAINSAFEADGMLRKSYMDRVERVIRACDQHGAVVILSCYYQRKSAVLHDEEALIAGIRNVAAWLQSAGFRNVVLETANEYPHAGFAHPMIRDPDGQARLLRTAKEVFPELLVTASGYGDGRIAPQVAAACDFLTPHWNGADPEQIPRRLTELRRFGKPIVCNEDDRTGHNAIDALQRTVAGGAGYGLMLQKHNQTLPFHFDGALDDPVWYAALRQITQPAIDSPAQTDGFPPPESAGGWPMLTTDEQIRTAGGMDPEKLRQIEAWLKSSDNRPFAAVVVHNGQIVLQMERNRDAAQATGNVKSCAKAICATVLAIAAEESEHGRTIHPLNFNDPAFALIPWAHPLSDPRKQVITVRQLLNHTSGITPESTGVQNRGPWEMILGHTGDDRNQRLAFDPGTDLDYGTHAFYHASLVCEHVTGQPYDAYAIAHLLQPIGVESWWFEMIDGDEKHGRHPSHAIGLPARDLARVGYCMLHNGKWNDQQVIPAWFVRETAEPTHSIKGIKTFGRDAVSFSHGWELPGLLSGEKGKGIPRDARFKPGSGGQLIAFVPSLNLVIARQTGESGGWEYERFLQLCCDAVLPRVAQSGGERASE